MNVMRKTKYRIRSFYSQRFGKFHGSHYGMHSAKKKKIQFIKPTVIEIIFFFFSG